MQNKNPSISDEGQSIGGGGAFATMPPPLLPGAGILLSIHTFVLFYLGVLLNLPGVGWGGVMAPLGVGVAGCVILAMAGGVGCRGRGEGWVTGMTGGVVIVPKVKLALYFGNDMNEISMMILLQLCKYAITLHCFGSK